VTTSRKVESNSPHARAGIRGRSAYVGGEAHVLTPDAREEGFGNAERLRPEDFRQRGTMSAKGTGSKNGGDS